MPTAGAAQYRNFADRWSRGYATKAGTLGDGGQAKRGQLRQWREEFDAAQQGRSQLLPFTPLAASVASVRRALFERFGSLPPDELEALPALLQTQVAAGRAFSERSVVVVVGEGRSGTTLLGQAVFDALPSFVYLYEPCRLTHGSLHGEECALFVARALSCRLSLDEFSLLLDDWPAFAKACRCSPEPVPGTVSPWHSLRTCPSLRRRASSVTSTSLVVRLPGPAPARLASRMTRSSWCPHAPPERIQSSIPRPTAQTSTLLKSAS